MRELTSVLGDDKGSGQKKKEIRVVLEGAGVWEGLQD